MTYTFAHRTAGLRSSAIRDLLKLTEMSHMLSLAGGLPTPDSFPLPDLRREADRLLGEYGPRVVQYSATDGVLELRQWIADEYTDVLGRAIAVFDGRIPGRRVVAAAPVLLQPAVIEPVLCEQLLAASEGQGDLVLLDGALADAVVDRVQHRLVPPLRRAFGASVTHVEGLRVQSVGVGQSLGDLDTEARFDLLVTLNAGGYTGGETRFRGFSPDLHDGPAGAAMVYASGLAVDHLPVWAGARRVLRLGLR